MSRNPAVTLPRRLRATNKLGYVLGLLALSLLVSSCSDESTTQPKDENACPVQTDFTMSMAPFSPMDGDVYLQGGRLYMVRTGSHEADAYATFPASGTPFHLTGDLSLLTSQSRVSVAVQDSSTQIGYHVVLQNETQNGSQAGLFLFYNTRHGNSETPPSDVLIQHFFTPAADHVFAFRLDRSSSGEFTLWLDGTEVGTAQDTRVTAFNRVWLNAGQDTSGGHGASVGNIALCGSVQPGTVTVSVQPRAATVAVSQTQQFAATVSGTTNTAVSWSVDGGTSNGTMTPSGLYTAPATVPTPPTVTVRATSAADTTKSGTAVVTVASACLVQTDFTTSMAPFSPMDGDVYLQGGRLFMVRTGSHEADAHATFSASWGTFQLTGDLSLLTSQSRVSVAVQDSSTQIGYHVVLQNETQNGSQAGLFLFYNTRHGNSETPPSDVLIQHFFTPAADHVFAFRLDRSSSGEFTLWLDGTEVGTAQDTRVTTFDRVWLNAGQDSFAGHGASLGNVSLCE